MTNTSESGQHIAAYVLKDHVARTTIRSSHGSWFIGTLLKGSVFYHHPSAATRDSGYGWIYSPSKNGAYEGFGWVKLEKIQPHQGQPGIHALSDRIVSRLHHPFSRRSRAFVYDYTDHPYPPHKSDDAAGKIEIKHKVHVPFYANQKQGSPTDQHPQKPFLDSHDDVRARYIVKHTHGKLIAVDYYRSGFHNHSHPKKGDGVWGFILKTGDNFSYRIA